MIKTKDISYRGAYKMGIEKGKDEERKRILEIIRVLFSESKFKIYYGWSSWLKADIDLLKEQIQEETKRKWKPKQE